MKTHTQWTICSGCVLSLGLIAQLRAQPVPVGLAEPLELPAHIVRGQLDLPAPESWQYARIDGFEVLSNAPQREANRLLKDFQMFRQALQIVRPASAPPAMPAALILSGRSKFADFTSDGQEDYTGISSVFSRDRTQAAIILNLGSATYTPEDGSSAELPVDYNRELYRQYVRFLLSRSDNPPPPWLIEGTIQVIMDMEFRDRLINYGRLDPKKGAPLAALLTPGGMLDVNASPDGSGGGTTMNAGSMVMLMTAAGGASGETGEADVYVGDRPFNLALMHRPLMPLGQFFAVPAGSREARNPLGNRLWAKQAYAFVHLCLFSADGKFQQPFATFVHRLANEPASERLFKECFQLSYAEMLKEIYAYIRYPRHKFRDIKLTEEGRLTATDVEFRPATQGEIGRIKGDAQRLAGRHAEALLTLRVAYARGERDPALLAALGVAEHHAGHSERARTFLEAAARLGMDRPAAYVGLARLRLAEARQKSAPGGQLDAPAIAMVLAPLLKARQLKPALPDTYILMAEAWSLSVVPPTAANIHLLGEGIMQFPFDSSLTLHAAQLYVRAGDFTAATEVARMGLRFAPDAASRARFQEFLATLPEATPQFPPAGDSASTLTS